MDTMNLSYWSSRWVRRAPLAREQSKIGFELVLAALTFAASSAYSVTLAWDPASDPAGGIAGYRVYQGTNSRAYAAAIDAGTNTQAGLTGLVDGVTYFFAVTAYNSAGLESDFSTEISYTPNGFTNQAVLTFAAASGAISAPFVVSNGVVYQTTLTTPSNGGRAAYDFLIVQGGPYVVSAMVNAPDGSANSFYVNIDAEPTDPQNIWDIPLTTGFMSRTVSWASGGSPQAFYLAAGTHQLIVRGREPNTQLSSVTISPAHGVLQITRNPDLSILLSGLADQDHTYDVQASSNFSTWTTIGSVSPDKSGGFTFTDPSGATLPMRVYRLRDQAAAALAVGRGPFHQAPL
jgi:hypothetical protein